MLLNHHIHQILYQWQLGLFDQVTQTPCLFLFDPAGNQLKVLCTATVQNTFPGFLLIVLLGLNKELVLEFLLVDVGRLDAQLDQDFQRLSDNIVMYDFSVPLRLNLAEYNLLISLQYIRVLEDSLLEQQLPTLLNRLQLLLHYIVLVKIHGDVADHAQTEHVVLPQLIELGQEVFSIAVLESFFEGQDVSLDGFGYFFVEEFAVLVDDQGVGIAVELFEG